MRHAALAVSLACALCAPSARAHQGPPFPMFEDRVAGAYKLAIWTDPDATDDGTAGGRFWVVVHAAADGAEPDGRTRVTVAARPLDRPGAAEQRVTAVPQPGAPARYFAAVVMDHEGQWQVEATLDGPLGSANASEPVAATYDLRPPLVTLPFLVLPFLLVGFLWLKAMRTRRRARLTRRA